MPVVLKYAKRKKGRMPFVPIAIRGSGNAFLKCVALIDSGSDRTVLPKNVAKFLQLKGQPTDVKLRGIGNCKVRKAQLQVLIYNDKEKHIVEVPCLIPQSQALVPIIIGRSCFFDTFHITFKHNEEKIIFEKVAS